MLRSAPVAAAALFLAAVVVAPTNPVGAQSSVPTTVVATGPTLPKLTSQTVSSDDLSAALGPTPSVVVVPVPAVPVVPVVPAPNNAPSTTKKRTSTKKKAPVTTTTPAAPVAEPAVAADVSTSGAGNSNTSNTGNTGNTGIPESTWAALRKCESGGNYKINTGNGYYGAYQFAAGTWRRLGYSGLPHEAAPAVQDEAARKLQAKAGWGQWPACTRKLGLR